MKYLVPFIKSIFVIFKHKIGVKTSNVVILRAVKKEEGEITPIYVIDNVAVRSVIFEPEGSFFVARFMFSDVVVELLNIFMDKEYAVSDDKEGLRYYAQQSYFFLAGENFADFIYTRLVVVPESTKGSSG